MFHSHPFEDLKVTKEKRAKAIQFVKENGVSKFIDMLVPTFFAPALKENYKSEIDSILQEAIQLSIQSVNESMEAMRVRPDMQQWVEELSCPYHCILGTEDIPAPFDFCLPQVNLASITKMTVLEGIGHMGMFSAKEETQSELSDFISYCAERKVPI